MAQITLDTPVDWKSLPTEEAISLAMKLFNFQRSEAIEYVSIAQGTSGGDVIGIDKFTGGKTITM